MKMVQPIIFDEKVIIKYPDGTTEESTKFPGDRGQVICTFTKMNGYDNVNNRVTNLVGYDGESLLKLCPNCNEIKKVEEFGTKGRTVVRKRDQSHCIECRKPKN